MIDEDEMINTEVKRYIQQSVLCWLATSNIKNEPNVSPKELFTYSDDETLLIANLASPTSIHNILESPNVCVAFVDVFVQKGFKIKGIATLIDVSIQAPSYFLYPGTTEETEIRHFRISASQWLIWQLQAFWFHIAQLPLSNLMRRSWLNHV